MGEETPSRVGREPATAEADLLCGPDLPPGLELLPESESAPSAERLAPEFEGQLAERASSGSVSVERRWPVLPQPLYATGDEMAGTERLFVSGSGDGPLQLQIGEEVEVDGPQLLSPSSAMA